MSIQVVREHYDTHVQNEFNRLEGRPELLLTCRMLDRYIKPGDKVLDIGGGPGRYSFYLAEKGCDVTLFDLSSENVKFAKKLAAEKNLDLHCVTGDAREADELISGQFDHVLLMGPLYHLLEEADRVQAVNAALRLLKPSGLMFAAFIQMSANLIFLLRDLPELIIDPGEELYIKQLLERRSYSGAGFTQVFFINLHEVLPFMEQFPMDKLHLFGQESILSPNESNLLSKSPEVIEAWLDIAEKMWERDEYLSWSEHLMYVGRKYREGVD